MDNYYFTKRMDNGVACIKKRKEEIKLSGFTNRLDMVNSLSKIYAEESAVLLTPMDYENIYTILYLLCISDFQRSHVRYRQKTAKYLVKVIRNNNKFLAPILLNLMK